MSTYWHYYNLEHDPFAQELGTSACYLPAPWKQLLELLQHLSQTSQAVLLVTGLSGIGKTTLQRQFVEQMGSKAGVCHIQGDDSVGPDVLRYLLAKHLDLKLADNTQEAFHQQMLTQLTSMQEQGKCYLLVVDDAHLLPERTLEAIIAIATQQPDAGWPLHVALFGGPQLEATVADITAQHFSDGVIHTSRIKPLTREAMEQYIYHRLEAAGLVDDFPFATEELDEIYQTSGGIPAKINLFAAQMLEDKIPGSRGSHEAKAFPSKKLGLLGAILGGCIVLTAGFLLFQQHDNATSTAPLPQASQASLLPGSDQTADLDDGEGAESQGGPWKQAAEVASDGSIASSTETLTQSNPSLKADPFNPVDEIHPAAPTLAAVDDIGMSEPVAGDNDESTSPKVIDTESTPSPEMQSAEPIPAAQSAEPPPTQPALPPSTAPGAVISPLSMNTATLPDAAKASPAKSETKAKAKPVTAKTPVVASTKKAAKTSKSTKKLAKATVSPKASSFKDEKQLLAANSQHYVLQIMGAYDVAALQNFVKKAQLQGKLRYYRTGYHGKPWYVVVYGDYANVAQAKQAAKKLPAAVQAVNPWPRQLSGVQRAIKEQNTHAKA